MSGCSKYGPAVVCISIAMVILTGFSTMSAALAEDIVHFNAITYQLSQFQKDRAKARGEPGESAPGISIKGYLSKPAAPGRFPAIVALHGCSGLSPFLRSEAERIRDWGYVVLVPDSFEARGIKDACAPERSQLSLRVDDALGALVHLSKLDFVDPTRIAVLGYSHGGGAALKVASVAQRNVYDMPENLWFKAAATYYPPCEVVAGELTIPTLILIGALDDWTLASDCETLARREANRRGALDLFVYLGAYHSFNAPALAEGRRVFGHWYKYDEPATKSATSELRRFLDSSVAGRAP